MRCPHPPPRSRRQTAWSRVTPDGPLARAHQRGDHRIYLMNVARDSVERVITTNPGGDAHDRVSNDGRRACWRTRVGHASPSTRSPPCHLIRTSRWDGTGRDRHEPQRALGGDGAADAGQVAVIDAGRVRCRRACRPGRSRSASPSRRHARRAGHQPGSDDRTILDLAARHVIDTIRWASTPGESSPNQKAIGVHRPRPGRTACRSDDSGLEIHRHHSDRVGTRRSRLVPPPAPAESRAFEGETAKP